MANQIKRTISISPESDYEIHRLAKLWEIPVSKARERCYHHAAAVTEREKVIEQDTGYDTGMNVEDVAAMRQAEAKVEMLKAAAS